MASGIASIYDSDWYKGLMGGTTEVGGVKTSTPGALSVGADVWDAWNTYSNGKEALGMAQEQMDNTRQNDLWNMEMQNKMYANEWNKSQYDHAAFNASMAGQSTEGMWDQYRGTDQHQVGSNGQIMQNSNVHRGQQGPTQAYNAAPAPQVPNRATPAAINSTGNVTQKPKYL